MTNPASDILYLKKAGWRKVSEHEAGNPLRRWLDPTSGKPPRRVLVQPEMRDIAGRVEKDAVYQVYESIPPWHYSREEAVRIQQDRDRAKGKQ